MLGIYFCILILNLSGLLHFLKYTHFVYKSSKCYLRMINFTLHFLVLRILLKNSCLCHSKSKMEVSRRRCRQGAAQRWGSGRRHWKACELQAVAHGGVRSLYSSWPSHGPDASFHGRWPLWLHSAWTLLPGPVCAVVREVVPVPPWSSLPLPLCGYYQCPGTNFPAAETPTETGEQFPFSLNKSNSCSTGFHDSVAYSH